MKRIFTLLLLATAVSFANGQVTYRWIGNGSATQTVSARDGFFDASNYRLVNANGSVSSNVPTQLPAGSILELVGVSLTLTNTNHNTTTNNYTIVVRGGSRPGLATPDFRDGILLLGTDSRLRLRSCGNSSIELRTGVFGSTYYYGRISLAAQSRIEIRRLNEYPRWSGSPTTYANETEVLAPNNRVYRRTSNGNTATAPNHSSENTVNGWDDRGAYECSNGDVVSNIRKAEGPSSGVTTPFVFSSGLSTVLRAVNSPQQSNGTSNSAGFAPVDAGAISLPVQLINFTASKGNGKVRLNWTTSQELDSDFFEVQRSTDGSNWSVLSRVKAAGNSDIIRNYQYEDAGAFSGNVMYRIRMVDTDATYVFSSILRLSSAAGNGKIVAYPNPASGFTTISSDNTLAGDVTVAIYDMASGNLVKQQRLRNPGNVFRLGLEDVAAGNYVIKIYQGQELLESIKLVRK